MKTPSLILILLLIFSSCKQKEETQFESNTIKPETEKVETRDYPENITKVFNAHGGLDQWNKMKTLTFNVSNPEGVETTTTDLKNRMALIETDKFKIGFDGSDVWMKQDTKGFEGNPKFYYNLMFYFYAMPFVLSDQGITYKDAQPLTVDGKTYPGIQISFGNEVGESPDDEYVLYYDNDTNKMTWLAYTVTYFSKEKSKDFHYIKYSEWQDVNGLLLPKKLQWYNYEDGKITTMKNEMEFNDVNLTESKMNSLFFKMPEGGNKL